MRIRTLLVAVVAVIFATAGSAGAARLITGAQIKNNTITGGDVRNRSLTPRDFRGSVRGPQGVQGIQGAQGAPGAPGAKGDTGPAGPTQLRYVRTQIGTSIANGASAEGDAPCPAGTRPVGGGAETSASDPLIRASHPTPSSGTPTGWKARVKIEAGGPANVFAWAVCTPSTDVNSLP